MGIELSSSKVHVLLYLCCIYCYNAKVWFFKILKIFRRFVREFFFTMSSTQTLPRLDVLFQLFKPLCLCVCLK